ncbi:hypothetical protein IB276_35525, partial [Ensifer sp. ENS04]|uniref:DUF6867 family protein n=1 Tax=Ensifer sp. ENS04 TaxID=2769281 RepID=UPI001782E3B1
FISCVLGGWTAWRTGKSVAESWEGMPRLILYVALLGLGIRFVHHALFGAPMLDLTAYALDCLVLTVISLAAFRQCRTQQMTERYYWLFEKTSRFSWRRKTDRH